LLKADLHTHTHYSPDCLSTPESVIERCLKVGVNCLAVTDHNRIDGALEMERLAPFTVIVGEEVKTTQGEIIGYFLKEHIPRGLSPQETVERIKVQGGLVCVPHPFDRVRRSVLRREALQEIASQIDIVEVLNARVTLGKDLRQARAFASRWGLPASAGSDAHTPGEIGTAYVEMPEFGGVLDFCRALAQGRIRGHRALPWVHLFSAYAKWRKKGLKAIAPNLAGKAGR